MTGAPRPAAVARLVLAVLTAVAFVVAPATWPVPGRPAPASAAEGNPIAVAVDTLQPTVATREGTVLVSGHITNTSSTPVHNTRVFLWRNQNPITREPALDRLLSGDSSPDGSQVLTEGAFVDPSPEGPVMPGQRLPFTVSASVEALDFPRQGGAYLIGVEVTGQPDAGRRVTVGGSRLLLPVPSAAGAAEVPATTVSTVVALTSRPSRYAPDLFSDDHLAEELAVGGRLTRLLASARRAGVSWAVDPALVGELQEMADGYRVRQPDGQLLERPGSEPARRWLADLAELDTANGYRLPTAVPDLTALLRQDLPGLARAARHVEPDSPVARLRLLGWSGPDGVLDDRALAALREASATVVLAANATGGGPVLADGDGAPVVRYQPGAFDGGPGTSSDPVHQRQRLLATTMVSGLTGASPTVRLVTTAEQAEADAGADAPWVRRQPLATLLAQPQPWNGALDTDRPADPATDRYDRITRLQTDFADYAAAMAEPAPTRERAADALLRASSSAFVNEPQAYAGFVAPLESEVDDFFSGRSVRLTAPPRITMSAKEGSFPVTVVSRRAEEFRVAITFTSANAQRLSVPRMADIAVGGNQATTVAVTPRAAANGTVPVVAQLTTPSGRRIGNRITMDVAVTDLGTVGWIIVVASGAVLLGSTALRIRQVRRERARDAVPEPDRHDVPLLPDDDGDAQTNVVDLRDTEARGGR